MSYAIIRTGGKQYRVSEGDSLKIEKIDAQAGEDFRFEDVLMVRKGDDLIFDPKKLAKIKVTAKVIGHGRGVKIRVFKFKRRKGYSKRQGHRQDYTEVKFASVA